VKQLLAFTVLSAALAVALTPAAFADEKEANIAAFEAAGFTLVNEDCADTQLFNELSCYSKNTPLLIAPGERYVYGRTYEEILMINPGIQDYLVDGYLPPKHWIATDEPTVD
jgi:hypothetical protein